MFKRLLKIAAWFLGIVILLLIMLVIYVRSVSVTDAPEVAAIATESFKSPSQTPASSRSGRIGSAKAKAGFLNCMSKANLMNGVLSTVN